MNSNHGIFGVRAAVLAALSLLVLAGVAQAQGSGASIIGTVRDESNAVLPGVTVTVASPALQVASMTTVTNEQGEYRVSPLPIGVYSVTYELQGFQSLKQTGLQLTVGFVAKIDVNIKIGTVSETITVSGAAPMVDVVNTAATTQLTQERLQSIPGARNGLITLMAAAPGTRGTKDVGGSALADQPTFRAFGQSGEAWNLLEGVFTNAPQSGGGAGNYFDFSTLDEARISTLGNDASTPTRGIAIVSVAKSGSNQLHGSVSANQTPKAFQFHNLDDYLISNNITTEARVMKRRDQGADIGGKIVQDKLWYYLNGRRRTDREQVPGAFKPDGSPMPNEQATWWHSQKLSYQMSTANKFVLFHQYTHKLAEEGSDQVTLWEARSNQNTLVKTGKAEWQAVKKLFVVSLQGGYWEYHSKQYGEDHGPKEDRSEVNHATGISMTDSTTGVTWGESTGVGTRTLQRRKHTSGTIDMFKPNFFQGNHEFKAGFDFLYASASRANKVRQSPPYQLVFRGGTPDQFRTQVIPNKPLQVTPYLGTYFKDIWTLRKRVTLDLGIRFAHDTGSVPAACREAVTFAPAQCFSEYRVRDWDSFAPRLHAAVDLFGNGRTVAKFGWGRFDHMHTLEPELRDLDPKSAAGVTYRWHDNGDKLYQPGEVDLNVNGPDYLSGGAGITFMENLNDLQPMSDEVSGSLERQIMRNLAVRVTGIYSRNTNTFRVRNTLRPPSAYNIAISKPDPGPDNIVGNADDTGKTLTYWEYSTALQPASFLMNQRINDQRANSAYTSYEVALSQRTSKGLSFDTSYSNTKINGPFGATSSSGPVDNPNAEIGVADNTNEWSFKVGGSYQLPFQISTSLNYEVRSGDPYSRTVQVTGGTTITSFVMPVDPRGTYSLPKFKLMDLRIRKNLRLAGGRRVNLEMSTYNLLNANTVASLQTRSGSSFGKPTGTSAILQPRSIEVSSSFSF